MRAAGSRAEFSAALGAARRARHLSIRELARIADVPSATAQGWLSGKHFPTPALRPQYLALVAALGLSEQIPEDLFDDPWRAMQPSLRHGAAPYLGLRPFGIADAHFFFGRDAESARLAGRVAQLRSAAGHGILALIGPSGSGKSSLLAAGLLATECTEGGLAGWRARAVGVAQLADCDPAGLDLVVVDQFEDALRLPEREDCAAALQRLGEELIVVIGLRSDAFAEASQLPALRDALSAPMLLARATREELREVVVGPARLAGVTVEDELVRALLDDLASGPGGDTQAVLPLLSSALLATWAVGNGDRMTVADYYAAGGISQAVESLAEQVYGSLTAEQQTAAERLFLRLLGVSAEAVVRESLPLAAVDSLTRPVLDAFVAARMLTVTDDSVQISHDALLAHWQRLHDWVAARRDDLLALAKIRRAAAVWEDAGRDPSALIPVSRLEAVPQGLEDPERAALLTPLEHEFLQASEQHFTSVLVAERRANVRLRRQRRRALMLTALSTGLALIAGLAFWGMRDSQQLAESARLEAQSRQVATAARSQRAKDPNLQAQMALVSADLADTLEGRSALLDATAVDTPLQWRGDPEAVLVADGELVVRGGGQGRLTLWQAGELTHDPGHTWEADPSGGPIHGLALATVGGRRLLAVGGANVRAVWDVTRDPVLVTEFGPIESTTHATVFDPAGRVLFGADDGTVEVWELAATPRRVTVVQLDEVTQADSGVSRPAVSSLALTASGILHVGGPPASIARWRLTGEPERLPDLPTWFDDGGGLIDVRVLALALSPDGTRLAAGMNGQGVMRWELADETATELTTLTAFEDYVFGVGFSADSRLLIAASADQDVTVFDAATGVEVRRMTTPTVAYDAGFAADRPIAVGADGTLRVWPAQSPVWRSSGSMIYNMSGSADWLAGGSPYDGIALWRLGGEVARQLPTPVVGELPGRDIQQGAAMLAPNQAWLAGGTRDGRVLTWPLTEQGAGEISVYDAGIGYIAAVAISPDSRLLAAFEYQGERTAIFSADPESGELTRVALIETPDPQFTVFTAQSTLAVALASNRVALWSLTDPANPEAVGEIEFATVPQTVAALGDRSLLGVGMQDGDVSLWDVSDPANPVRLRGFGDPRSGMYSLEFSPDGTLLIGTSGDDQIWGWDLTSEATTALFSLNGDLGRPWDARFIEAGARFAVSGSSGAVKVWTADPVAAKAQLCANRGDALTAEEWERYLPGVTPEDPCRN